MASTAEKASALEKRAEILRQEKIRIEQSVANVASQGLEALPRDKNGKTSPDPQLSTVPSVLVADLCSLQLCEMQAVQLKELLSLSKQLDKQIRAVDRAFTEASVHTFANAVSSAVTAYAAAIPQCQKLQNSIREGIVQLPEIQRTADNLTERVVDAQFRIRQSVEQEMQARLGQVGWPPPLTQLIEASSSADSSETSSWSGFTEAPKALEDLKQLMASLTLLQQAVQSQTFNKAIDEGDLEGPLLWAVQVFAKPIGERLKLHFASGLPTDRPDKPEWLFSTALRMAGALGPCLDVFHSVLVSLRLDHMYSMIFEFVRAVKDEVKSILRRHTLPALCNMRDSAAWCHMGQQAVEWDKKLAKLQGLTLSPDEPPGSAGWAAECCVGVMFEEQEWLAAWLQAEVDVAVRELDSALDSSSGWQALSDLWGEEQEDDDTWELSLSAAAGPSSISSDHEFYPPVCADTAVAIVTAIIRRSRWLGTKHHRKKFLKAVAQEVLKVFRARLTRECKNLEAGGRDISAAPRCDRIAASVCAAHYLEFQLREPELLALLDADTSASSNATALPSPLPRTTSPVSSTSAASSNTGHGSGLASFLDRESTAFGWVRKEWTLKLAKAVATSFTDATKSYRNKLDHFSGDDSGVEVHPAVTTSLLPAVKQLQTALTRLSRHLDSVVFGELWRAVAVAANRLIFNDVATEASFSKRGTRQFSTDCDALVWVFREFTPRPAAHFKEVCEACKLLALEEADLASLLPYLTSWTNGTKSALAAVGVHRLTHDQALAVLARRL